jgi:hypothetical protein
MPGMGAVPGESAQADDARGRSGAARRADPSCAPASVAAPATLRRYEVNGEHFALVSSSSGTRSAGRTCGSTRCAIPERSPGWCSSMRRPSRSFSQAPSPGSSWRPYGRSWRRFAPAHRSLPVRADLRRRWALPALRGAPEWRAALRHPRPARAGTGPGRAPWPRARGPRPQPLAPPPLASPRRAPRLVATGAPRAGNRRALRGRGQAHAARFDNEVGYA